MTLDPKTVPNIFLKILGDYYADRKMARWLGFLKGWSRLKAGPQNELEPALLWTFLSYFLLLGDYVAADELLKIHPDLLVTKTTEFPTGDCDSPLQVAMEIMGDRPDAIRWMIDHGANVNQFLPLNFWRPVHYAAIRGHVGCLAVLLEAGADVETGTTIDGNNSALMEAAISGERWAAFLLLLNNADLDRKGDHGEGTAEEIAQRGGHREMAEFLRWLKQKQDRPKVVKFPKYLGTKEAQNEKHH